MAVARKRGALARTGMVASAALLAATIAPGLLGGEAGASTTPTPTVNVYVGAGGSGSSSNSLNLVSQQSGQIGASVALPTNFGLKGIAVDPLNGNIFAAGTNAIDELASGASAPTTLLSGLSGTPSSIVTDTAGNLYYLLSGTLYELPSGDTLASQVQNLGSVPNVGGVLSINPTNDGLQLALPTGQVLAIALNPLSISVLGTLPGLSGTPTTGPAGIVEGLTNSGNLEGLLNGTVSTLASGLGNPSNVIGMVIDANGDTYLQMLGGTIEELLNSATSGQLPSLSSPVPLTGVTNLSGPIALAPGLLAPSAPSAPVVTPGSGSATVTYQANASTLIPPSYSITATSTTGATTTVPASGTTVAVPGLNPGQTYGFTVSASNAAGTSTSPSTTAAIPAASSNPGTPGTPGTPGAPGAPGTPGYGTPGSGTGGYSVYNGVATVHSSYRLTTGRYLHVLVGQTFAQRMRVVVYNSYGQRLKGVVVTFTVTGPARFPHARRTAVAVTNGAGVAASPRMHALGNTGLARTVARVRGITGSKTYRTVIRPR